MFVVSMSINSALSVVIVKEPLMFVTSKSISPSTKEPVFISTVPLTFVMFTAICVPLPVTIVTSPSTSSTNIILWPSPKFT